MVQGREFRTVWPDMDGETGYDWLHVESKGRGGKGFFSPKFFNILWGLDQLQEGLDTFFNRFFQFDGTATYGTDGFVNKVDVCVVAVEFYKFLVLFIGQHDNYFQFFLF
jgi:hypothetical protein